jgi:hypothetical protein
MGPGLQLLLRHYGTSAGREVVILTFVRVLSKRQGLVPTVQAIGRGMDTLSLIRPTKSSPSGCATVTAGRGADKLAG